LKKTVYILREVSYIVRVREAWCLPEIGPEAQKERTKK